MALLLLKFECELWVAYYLQCYQAAIDLFAVRKKGINSGFVESKQWVVIWHKQKFLF